MPPEDRLTSKTNRNTAASHVNIRFLAFMGLAPSFIDELHPKLAFFIPKTPHGTAASDDSNFNYTLAKFQSFVKYDYYQKSKIIACSPSPIPPIPYKRCLHFALFSLLLTTFEVKRPVST
jgi:hypothetical protein